jgi:hypothetical protein
VIAGESPYIDRAQAAVGGQHVVADVRTLDVDSHLTRVLGSRRVEFETRFVYERPNRCLRIETNVLGGSTTTRRIGFAADDLIFETLLSNGTMSYRGGFNSAQAKPAGSQRPMDEATMLRDVRMDCARTLLGMLAISMAAYDVRFVEAGRAEASDGAAVAVDALHDAEKVGRLFIDEHTNYPVLLSWQAPPLRSVQMPSGLSVSRDGAVASPPPAPSPAVEHRLYFAERRAVDGLMLPARITRAVDGHVVEELIIQHAKVNAPIDRRVFAPSS